MSLAAKMQSYGLTAPQQVDDTEEEMPEDTGDEADADPNTQIMSEMHEAMQSGDHATAAARLKEFISRHQSSDDEDE